MAAKSQRVGVIVRVFQFPQESTYEMPAHWTPFQVEVTNGQVWIWAYRNGG